MSRLLKTISRGFLNSSPGTQFTIGFIGGSIIRDITFMGLCPPKDIGEINKPRYYSTMLLTSFVSPLEIVVILHKEFIFPFFMEVQRMRQRLAGTQTDAIQSGNKKYSLTTTVTTLNNEETV